MDLWKICRVLDNPLRFALLRDIAASPQHALNVMQAADRARQKKSVTSQYLKQLADAGLLSVERRGCFAICASNRLHRSPLARLQQALADFFGADPDGKHDAAAFAKIRALSHHGRIRIVRKIADCEGGIRFDKLAKSTGLPPATLYRQIGALIAAEIVMPGEDSDGLRTYSIAPQPDGLFSVLASLALDPRLDQNSQSL
jgi:predicted transcriptional regulator